MRLKKGVTATSRNRNLFPIYKRKLRRKYLRDCPNSSCRRKGKERGGHNEGKTEHFVKRTILWTELRATSISVIITQGGTEGRGADVVY